MICDYHTESKDTMSMVILSRSALYQITRQYVKAVK